MLTFLKGLFRPSDRRRPEFHINDPRHPVNSGWRRVDLPEGRPVRFRVAVPEVPKVAPQRPELTNREYMDKF
ncbi:MAG TPA: hypothetical protein VKV74_06460 [Bryobacteraceae bacterium]|nr:hypothetical protein [Bryobacteraceae bacterium]